MNRSILRVMFWVGLACTASPFPARVRVTAADDVRPMNLLMIAVDDLRPELGCYGKSSVISPHIDALAASGVRFDRAYCQVAVCGASRASLLSGCRPETTGCWDYFTPLRKKMPDVLSLPEHFRGSGYETTFLGKVYHSPTDDPQGWSLKATEWAPPLRGKGRGYVADYPNRPRTNPKRPSLKSGPSVENGGDVDDEVYRDGMVASQATRLLQRFAQHDKPFFLAVGFIKPHLPFACPGKYWDWYERDQFVVPSREDVVDGVEYGRSTWGELKNYTDIEPKAQFLDDDKTRELIHGYHACVSYTDAQVGRVVGELDRLGLRDNTIIVLWGDHGWYVGDFGAWCKHTNYEIATRVPLLISAPGIEPASTDALVELVDLYPTLCELASLPVPDHCQGMTLTPWLNNPLHRSPEAAFSQYKRNKRGEGVMLGTSVRTDRFRFTRWVSEKTGKLDAEELIDFQTDPGATRNVIAEPVYESDLPALRRLATKSGSGV